MKEQPKGPLARMSGIAESVASTMRRRQQEREPRVVLYDARGRPRVVPRDSDGHDALLETGERLVGAATGE